MGQTLTHGIYLPDEGERNCYNGLAGNWSILDGAVGTIAEHTTQIAGKAPLVHTHTKSDITDFPAYGNAAGTICEGNDSRLSDARTPVAHTHTKSDVTDLFNSANTWSGMNTFSNFITAKESGAIPVGGYGKGIVFRDYQNNRLGYIQPSLTSDSEKRLLIGADSGDVASNSNLIPNTNNSVNLGSSSYQWNNLYAKNYYYNGVAWGLDKANEWTQDQAISKNWPAITLKDTIGARETTPAVIRHLTIYFNDKNGNSYGFINRQHKADTGSHLYQVSINNGTYDYRLQFYLYTNGKSDFMPSNNGVINLGNSTNKWATLNGVNPGALSGIDSSASIDMDTTNWVYNGVWKTLNTAAAKGWGYIILSNCGANDFIAIRYGGTDKSFPCIMFPAILDVDSKYYLCALFQVVKNQDCRIKILSSGTLEKALFYPSLGNV